MRKILIVGSGQSGLQLALGLQARGYDVTVMTARTAEEIRDGQVMSTQCMFEYSLDLERGLGLDLWAVMGSDRGLIQELLAAGEAEGEPGWELPLWTDYRRHIESSVADVKNIGIRYGGAITAGLFLKEFVGDVPWAHLDVASTAFVEHGGDFWPRGATGSPTRTIIRYIERQAESDQERPAPRRRRG